MEREEIKHRLRRIIANIASIQSLTTAINYFEFRQNEGIRDKVYAHLNEIGKDARELKSADRNIVPNISQDELADFKAAKEHKNADVLYQNTWNLIELDLPVIAEEIRQSAIYRERQSSESMQ